MPELCDLQIHINGQQTFFLNQKIISTFSGRLKKIIKQEKRKTRVKNLYIEIDDFPGGPEGFELASRFCYNNGRIAITVSNVSVLHCCAIFLGMTEKVSPSNLLQQTEAFLEGMFYWSWNDILICLKNCESFFTYVDSSDLVKNLICSLLAKINAQNSDINLNIASPSSSSSSPETASGFRFSSPTKTTPESIKPYSTSKAWWFDGLAILPPNIIQKVIKTLGAYGTDNNNLILTKFLLHYLKTAVQSKGGIVNISRSEYGSLANTAVYGVILVGKSAFSYRGLFWVLRVVSGFGLSRDCRGGLERLIGGMIEKATLDDLLVSGHDHGGVYDVKLVLRLIRVFVNGDSGVVHVEKMKKVGRLIDKYLREISPDHNLKMSKFLGVAESLPDSARDCFDGVYRAIDIYLESHPTLSFEERTRLCRCLNYEKLSLEACKDLAKNPRIPPRIAVQALVSQQSNNPTKEFVNETSATMTDSQIGGDSCSEENEDMRLNLQRMQWRVVELEKVCRNMKGQMSRLVKGKVISSPAHNRALPRLC